MKRRFTILTAALALLTFLAVPMGMWGQTRDDQVLTNANIVAAGAANNGYQSWNITDGNSHTWNAYAIKNQHSNATSGYHFLQIKKYASNTAYYIQVPVLGTKITSITMTVSSSSKPMDGGENSATLFFSSSNSTSSAGTGVASGTGASLVTIDCSNLNLNTGYITASAGVRIWDVSVTYTVGSLEESDLALTGAPVALSFDLYNNSDAQTVSYTTSSTGAITITPGTSGYFTYEHNASAKTITVSPTAVTPSAQTVTISQAGDATYAPGSASFTVSITNSEPTIGIPEEQLSLSCEANENGIFSVSFTNGFVPNAISPTLYSDAACQNPFPTPGDNAWIVLTEGTDQNTINYSVAANSNSSNNAVERTAYLKVTAVDYDYNHSGNQVSINNVFAVTQAAPDYATLPFEFNGGRAEIATTNGLTYEYLGSDYSSSPKLRFDQGNQNNDDKYSTLVLKFNERPGTLSFDIKGNNFSGGSTFKVQTSVDGVSYSDLKTYNTFDDNETQLFNDLDENVRYIKWIYTKKVNGNVALGNIALAKYVAPQEYTLEVTSVSNAEIIVFDATDPVENNWVQLFEGVGSAQVLGGTPIALSVSAYEGYALESLMVNGVNHVADIDGGLYSFTITGDVTITATAAAIPMAIYSYSNNGVEGQTLEAAVGSTIDLQAGADLSSDFTFVGWTTDPNDVSQQLTDFTFNEENVYVFYAVYEHTTTVGAAKGNREGATYEKVTSISDVTDGNYLIVYEEGSVAFNGSLETLDATNNTISVTISDSEIASSTETDNAIFTIAAIDGGYSIKSKSGYYIGNTKTGSKPNGLSTSNETVYVNSIEFENSNLSISSLDNNGITTLKYNSANDQKRFRFFGSGQQAIQLYKYTEGGVPTPTPVTTTAHYTRVFLANPTANVSIVGPSIIPNGITLNMGENELSNNLGAASFIIEDGAQYIGNSVEATVQKNIEACTYSQDNNAGYNLIASPVFDNLTAANVNGLLTNYYDLYKFDNTHEREWINYKAGAYTIDPEVGYLYASGSNTIIEFAGDLNEAPSSDVYDVTVAHKGFNLIGNPLPYNVAVVDEEFNLVDYQVLTSDGGAFEASSNNIAPCNAILVQTANDNETVYFLDPSLLEESKAVNIKLVENAKQVDNVRVRFGEGRGMNKFYLNNNISHVYFQQGNEEMAIVRSAAEAELPVSFRASENGTYTLAVEAENIDMNYLHLIDNMTGMDIDLLQTPSYTFEANTNDYANRFKLVFAANGTDEADESSFAFFSNGNLIVNNEGNATLQVIDINGRILSSETISGSCSKAINATTGVYMLRLINGENVKVQKVVVR